MRDGKIWSSGSVGNGQEMVVGFLRGLGPEKSGLVETVLGMSDVGTRGQDY